MFEDQTKNLMDWLEGKPAAPTRVHIDISNKCNLRCLSCNRYENIEGDTLKNSGNVISKRKWMKIIREVLELGVKECYIDCEGEPFYDQETALFIIKEIKKNDNIRGGMVTNCTLLNKKIIETLIKINWDYINISLDGPDAETHDYIRGVPGTFNKVIKNIKMINKFKKMYKKENPKLKIYTILYNRNFNKIEKMVTLAHKLACDELSITPLVVYTDNKIFNKLILSKKQLDEFDKHIRRGKIMANKLKLNTNFDDFFEYDMSRKKTKSIMMENIQNYSKSLIYSPCFSPWLIMRVTHDGKVLPCFIDDFFEPYNGSIKEIWFGKKFNKLREQFIEKKIPETCCGHATWLNEKIKLREMLIKNIETANAKEKTSNDQNE